MVLSVGENVPDFALLLATQERKRRFRFSEALGKGPVVIAFYPLAFTGVCTREVCDLRDAFGALAALDAQVFGFSIDTADSNRAFARAHGLAFGLLSDPNREVVHEIWETQTVNEVRACAKRGAMVADRDGIVRWVWITDDPEEWIGVDEIRRHLPA